MTFRTIQNLRMLYFKIFKAIGPSDFNGKFVLMFIFQEVKGQSLVFFLAGYETTSTALTLLVHVLSKYPRVQEKLHMEIDEHYPDKVSAFI